MFRYSVRIWGGLQLARPSCSLYSRIRFPQLGQPKWQPFPHILFYRPFSQIEVNSSEDTRPTLLTDTNQVQVSEYIREVVDGVHESSHHHLRGAQKSLLGKVKALAMQGKAEQIKQLLESETIELEPLQRYRSLISAYLFRGDLPKINTLIAEMPSEGVVPDIHIYTLKASCCLKLRDFRSIEKIINEELPSYSLVPDFRFVNVLLSSFIASQDISQAINLFSNMQKLYNITPTPLHYRQMISFLGKSKLPKATYYASSLLKSMKDKQMQITVEIYNALLDCYSKNGDFSNVHRLLSEMRLENVSPDISTCNSIINGLVRMGSLGDAFKMVNQMKSEGIGQDEFTYTPLLFYMANQRKATRVQQIWEEMKRNGIKVTSTPPFHARIKAYASLCLIDQAKAVIKEMSEVYGVSPDVGCYNNLMEGLVPYPDSPLQIRQCIDEMRAKGLAPDTVSYNLFIRSFAKQGNTQEFQKILEEMRKYSIQADIFTMNTMISGFSKAGQLKEGQMLLQQMARSNIRPDIVSYNSLLSGLAREKKVEAVKPILRQMTQRNIRPNRLTWATLEKYFGDSEVKELQSETSSSSSSSPYEANSFL